MLGKKLGILCVMAGALWAHAAHAQIPSQTPVAEEADAPSGAQAPLTLAAEMTALLDALENDIRDQEGDCARVARVLGQYDARFVAWREKLVYSSENIDQKTIASLTLRARALGKRLAQCYHEAQIAHWLQRWAEL